MLETLTTYGMPVLTGALSASIPIVITWFIAHMYHKKNESFHQFWQEKRDESIKSVIENIRTIRSNLRVLEKTGMSSIRVHFSNNIKSLIQFVGFTNSHLTINELDNISKSIQEYNDYLRNFDLKKNDQMEFNIVNSQNALTELIISFKLKDPKQINGLFQPISEKIASQDISSNHNWCKFMIEQSLQIKID